MGVIEGGGGGVFKLLHTIETVLKLIIGTLTYCYAWISFKKFN